MRVGIKKHGLTMQCFWFEYPEKIKKGGLVQYNNMSAPIELQKGQILISKRDAYTLRSDLRLSEDEITKRYDSNVRNEIRRAQKEMYECHVFSSPEKPVPLELINKFDAEHAEMNKQKGLPAGFLSDSLVQYNEQKVLVLTTAGVGDDVVAYHVYLCGDGIARLLYSVSSFRKASNLQERTAIGRANRLLHYEDMIHFKKEGYITYDWGGYAMNEEFAGINAFKRGFGGVLGPSYYAMVTNSRLIASGVRIYEKIKKRK